ncbi:uncharacterized protein LOC130719123 isoform X2 [Lotus japonicus]|uniref:uncharacterized protein LOC130719123 isoform X2 n=1 Tax=Lotus japonicus TaxID=34305 RepID=UPI002586CB0F|nr:uncharacterized protein LOC130719123 isoform X2 [Lotus japonicus]
MRRRYVGNVIRRFTLLINSLESTREFLFLSLPLICLNVSFTTISFHLRLQDQAQSCSSEGGYHRWVNHLQIHRWFQVIDGLTPDSSTYYEKVCKQHYLLQWFKRPLERMLKNMSKTLVAIVAKEEIHHTNLRYSTKEDPK